MKEIGDLKPGIENGLPFDPDSSGKADPEAVWKNRESKQGHEFRTSAFYLSFSFSLILFALWLVVMFSFWPDKEASAPIAAVYISKSALFTIVFLAVLIATMRFAIQCYGHHNKKDDMNDVSSMLSTLLKITEKIGGQVK